VEDYFNEPLQVFFGSSAATSAGAFGSSATTSAEEIDIAEVIP